MGHNFFFYNKLKNTDIINKIHNDYTINESTIIIDKTQCHPNMYTLMFKKSIKKEILDDNKIKVYGKYVTFNNITLDNIVNKIINLNLSYKRKHTMLKVNNVSILSNNIIKNLNDEDNPWIIV